MGSSSSLVVFDASQSLLSFSIASLDILDDIGCQTGGIDPAFASDPVVSGTLTVTDLQFVGQDPDGRSRFTGGQVTLTDPAGQFDLSGQFGDWLIKQIPGQGTPTGTSLSLFDSMSIADVADPSQGPSAFLDQFVAANLMGAGLSGAELQGSAIAISFVSPSDLVAATHAFTQSASVAATVLVSGAIFPAPTLVTGKSVFGGTLTLSLGDLPPVRFQNVGVATVNGGPRPDFAESIGSHLSKVAISQSVFTGQRVIPVTDPIGIAANGITKVLLTVTNAAGSLARPTSSTSPGGPLTQNTLGLAGGLARLCIVSGGPGCALNLPLALGTTHTGGSQIVGLGVGGQQTIGGLGFLRISIDHAPWTVLMASALDQPDVIPPPSKGVDCFPASGQARCVVETAKGLMHGPASASSSVNLGTVSSPAVVQFVTPGQVTTNITATSSQRLQLLSRMRFKMVPEPGLVLLLGTGVAGLAALGRRRMRR